MASTSSSLKDVLELAKGTDVLTKEQLARIARVAPQMNPEDLDKLRLSLMKIREKATAKRKKQIEVYHRVATAQHEWKADQARTALSQEESASKQEENAELDQLLTKL